MKQIKTYKERRWLKVRESALRRDKYIDQIQKRYGIFKSADMVHHIFPVADFPEYQYELWNLISITQQTHNELHDIDGSLSEKGRQLLLRTARLNKIEVPFDYLRKPKRKRFLYTYSNERGIDE